MKIKHSFLVSCLLAFLLASVAIISEIIAYRSINTSSNHVSEVLASSFEDTNDILSKLQEMELLLLASMSEQTTLPSKNSVPKLAKSIQSKFKSCDKHLSSVDLDRVLTEEEEQSNKDYNRKILNSFEKAHEKWVTLYPEITRHLEQESMDSSEQAITVGKLIESVNDVKSRIQKFQRFGMKSLLSHQGEIQTQIQTATFWVIPLMGLVFSLLVLVGVVTYKKIIQPIDSLVNTMERIEKGNTHERFVYSGDNEMGYLARTFNQMVKKLDDSLRDREKSNQALRDQQELFHQFLEFFPDGIIFADEEGRVQQMNGKMVSLLGWKQEEMLGQSIEDFLPIDLQKLHILTVIRDRQNQASTRPMVATRSRVRTSRKHGGEFLIDIYAAMISMGTRQFTVAAIRSSI